jgi:hypothetical protein
MKKKMRVIAAMAVGLGISGIAWAEVQGTPSEPVSLEQQVTPYIIDGENPGGNRTCAEVGLAFFGDANYYEFSSERVNYDDEEGEFDGDFPEGLIVTTDGTYVSFNSTFGIGAVIVKGSDDANVYVYEPQVTSDSGLAAPLNESGNPAGLSNLTFCWNPEDEEECFEGETAWADGDRYTETGNWATYTPYYGDELTVDLLAGQTMKAGDVSFSEPVDGFVTITITLDEGWRFAPCEPDEEDNVKVQDYDVAPSGNPAPGLFDHKGCAEESPFDIEVPENNFYGVHVDVERRVACE